MSSIAYVTDEKMLEFHRLNRNHSMVFWRLSAKNRFRDFKKGDLLFFFARPNRGRRKGLIGYAHFDTSRNLSIHQMWNQYREATGYNSMAELRDAIENASRGELPEKMNCLFLKDVVFFLSPVYPEDVGLKIPSNLESYCYIDKNDPGVTVRILKEAGKNGIDLWSADETSSPDEIFELDEIRHQMTMISHSLGKNSGSERERTACSRIARRMLADNNWEMIRGSATDLIYITDDVLYIAVPFVSQANNRKERIRETVGKAFMYRVLAQQAGIQRKIVIKVISEKNADDVTDMVNILNDGKL